MEKRSPHYQLAIAKRLIEQGKVQITLSALAGGAALGLDRKDITIVVLALTSKDFYKSMTTHFDHRIWQDVYRPATSVGMIYVKLTVAEDVLIVSFKEL